MNEFYILKIDSNNNLDDIIITQANGEKSTLQQYYNNFNDDFKYLVFYVSEFEKMNFGKKIQKNT